ncbi:MAG: energy-coupling factor transporter transmembrane component T [Lachnospiraceae bacterium]|nr:energy-coupling factor transporter transmembrane component T [Lachnospiraceae bacterium]
MNRYDKALKEICDLDKEASGTSILNRLDPRLKLFITALFLLAIMWTKPSSLSLLLLLFIYPVAIFIIFDISVKKCIKRLKYIFEFVLIMAVCNLIFTPDKEVGFIMMIGVLTKGVLSIFAVYFLIATTKIEDLCKALRKMHVPNVLVTTILLIYRYVNVLIKEIKRMAECYSMNAVSDKGISMKYAGAFLGNLILRSIDKAQNVYDSMNLRGYEWSQYNEFRNNKNK